MFIHTSQLEPRNKTRRTIKLQAKPLSSIQNPLSNYIQLQQKASVSAEFIATFLLQAIIQAIKNNITKKKEYLSGDDIAMQYQQNVCIIINIISSSSSYSSSIKKTTTQGHHKLW